LAMFAEAMQSEETLSNLNQQSEKYAFPEILFYAFFTVHWIIYLWDLYLSIRQYRTQRNCTETPEGLGEILNDEQFQKARLYKLDKARFSFLTSTVDQLAITVILLLNMIPKMWAFCGTICTKMGTDGESVVFSFTTFIISTVFNFPFSVYSTFVIEERHGFNKQTMKLFICDELKKIAIMTVLALPVIAILIAIIKVGGSMFFVYVIIFLTIVSFLLLTIYPEYIAPLFNKYTPLPEGELRTRLEQLAGKVEYPLKKIFVVDGSKRSGHSNAYLYGFWKNKRIVLYDTLLADDCLPKDESVDDANAERNNADEKPVLKQMGMNIDEVVAVLGHELGHWKLWHNVMNIIWAEFNMVVQFGLFALLYKKTELYMAFGFYDDYPIIIGLIIIFDFVLAPLNVVLGVIHTYVSRQLEFAADDFSAKLGYAKLLQSGLIKLSQDNLAFPVNDWLYSCWHFSHPPVPERLAALRKKSVCIAGTRPLNVALAGKYSIQRWQTNVIERISRNIINQYFRISCHQNAKRTQT
ncbi:CAAX prenyl protease 1 -like protein, partial [Trichinella spiralis]